MQGRHGYRESTPDHLQLDSGELWANFDIDAFLADVEDAEIDITRDDLPTYGLNEGEAIELGATDGGISFDSNIDRNEIDFDGKAGRTKDMVRVDADGTNPEMSAELLELTQDNLERAVAGSVSEDIEGVTDFISVTSGEIKTEDYIGNVVCITTRSDGKPMFFEVRNCLVEAFSIDTDHGDEGAYECTFQAHFDENECTFDEYGGRKWTPPFRLVIPKDV